MKIELIKKIIANVIFDYYVVSANNLTVFQKINYLLNKYFCVLTNRREINYLGHLFHYDNRFSPVILGGYPKEISKIDKKINLNKAKRVLDIGANIGQFACTLKRFYPEAHIYCFEPNKEIYSLLKKNLSYFKEVDTYNFGLGNVARKRDFYFSPTASTEGSFYEENMRQNYKRTDVKKTKVEIISLNKKNIAKLNLPKEYDLVKIDVEGAEIEVLKSLKEIRTKYLFVEISVKRKGNNLEDVRNLIKKQWGVEPVLLYYDLPDKDSPAANLIFKL